MPRRFHAIVPLQLVAFLFAVNLSAVKPDAASLSPPSVQLLLTLPLAFEPNRGQAEAGVTFVARGAGYRILLGLQEAVLTTGADKNSWVHVRPVGRNGSSAISALEELPGKSNYLNGATPDTWHTNIPNYGRVLYRDVYPGIDLAYHGDEGKLEYDWIVHPGADPARIQVSFPGARRVRVDSGELVIEIAGGEVRNRQPVAYQIIGGMRRYVAADYVLSRARLARFRLGPYDRSAPLIIDPTLVYIKSLNAGGGTYSYVFPPAAGPDGSVYLLLMAPTLPGSPPPQSLVRLSPSGSVIATTQLGFLGVTSASGYVARMAVDGAGSVYLAGSSGPGLATTAGAFQPASRGSVNAFVTKLNPSGSGVVYSTYLGGSARDGAGAIAADAAGNAYITGGAGSGDFPTTTTALGACGVSPPPLFVAKLNATGTGLAYSSCIANARSVVSDDSAPVTLAGFAIDAAGSVYLAGRTRYAGFPTTPGAFQASPNSNCSLGDCYGVAFKLNPTGSAFVYSTYLPSPVDGMAVDSSGNAYLVADASVTKLDANGSRLPYSYSPAFSNRTTNVSAAVDATGALYLVTSVSNGSASGAGVDPIQGGFATDEYDCYYPYPKVSYCSNVVIQKVNAAGTAAVYWTYFGYHARGQGSGLVVDNLGNVYVTGNGWKGPVTSGAGGYEYLPVSDPLSPSAEPFLLKIADAGHTPTFVPAGIVNAASMNRQFAGSGVGSVAWGLGAGEIVTLFGSNLTTVQGILAASSFPLPAQLGGTSVSVDGVAAPIFAVANVNGQQQINFQMPKDVRTGGGSIWVTNNGVTSVPVFLQYYDVPGTAVGTGPHPGIFTTDGRRGAIQHGVGLQPVTSANPAARGEVVVLYATGLGPVQPDPGVGNPASATPLSVTTTIPTVMVGPPTIALGGKQAEVQFSGLAPGFVGLNQVNFRVPADAPSGDVDVVIQFVQSGVTWPITSNIVKLAIR